MDALTGRCCLKCGKEKEAHEFRKNRRYLNGLTSWCKTCHEEYRRHWRIKNREHQRHMDALSARRRRAALKARTHYALSPEYRERMKQNVREWRKTHPDWRKNHARRHTYGELREAVLTFIAERDGWLCTLCGKSLDLPKASYDHIVPVMMGGPHRLDNLRMVCKPCNMQRGAVLNRKYDEATE